METFVVQLKETRQAASLPESTLRFPLEYCHRPAGVFRYYRVRILAQFLERWNKFFVAAVPHGNHRVPPQPGKLGAPHWRSAKDFTEFFRLHFGQPTKRRIDQAFPRLELRRGSHRRLPVPRANILTDVASEDVPP